MSKKQKNDHRRLVNVTHEKRIQHAETTKNAKSASVTNFIYFFS